MTIKTRNRLDFALFIISAALFVFNVVFLIIRISNGTLNLEPFSQYITDKPFLTRYNPYITIGSLLYENLFVVVVSYLLVHIFEKTQASDVVFFCLFLMACLLDSVRLWIPLFSVNHNYSTFLFFIGTVSIMGKILIPLSLLFVVIYGQIGPKPDIEKYLFLVIMVSGFFAYIVPLNSAVINPNFSVDYSYKSLLSTITAVTIIGSLTAEVFINIKQLHTQKTTIGLAVLSGGILLLSGSSNIVICLISTSALVTGTVIFLYELHNQYLFTN